MRKIQMVDLIRQYEGIKDEVQTSLDEILSTAAFLNGPKVHEFQSALEDYLGVKHGQFCLVAGSTWPQDEDILVKYINQAPDNLKVVLVPHDIDEPSCDDLLRRIRKRAVRFTRMNLEEIHEYQVLLVDKVGLLTRIYSYANTAYIGGGFMTGLHNTLEPAVFGIPVVIGPKYQGFREAIDLVAHKGMFSIRSYSEFQEVMKTLRTDMEARQRAGRICADYVHKNTGASIRIVEGIRTLL